MSHGDVEKVSEIERSSPSPWSALSIAQELDRPQGLQLVATDGGGSIHAWCCGRCIEEEAELFKIAVVSSLQNKGIGTALLLMFEDLCRKRGCRSCLLEVRVANRQAVGFYEKFGYSKIGSRKDYYTAPQDDALILRKTFLVQK